jgi:hypothetical protein
MKIKRSKRSKGSKRLEAFRRTQEINEQVERATMENEILNSSEDMPVEESHVTALLDEEGKNLQGRREKKIGKRIRTRIKRNRRKRR